MDGWLHWLHGTLELVSRKVSFLGNNFHNAFIIILLYRTFKIFFPNIFWKGKPKISLSFQSTDPQAIFFQHFSFSSRKTHLHKKSLSYKFYIWYSIPNQIFCTAFSRISKQCKNFLKRFHYKKIPGFWICIQDIDIYLTCSYTQLAQW